jgi:undecaprenyl-diphosphatase
VATQGDVVIIPRTADVFRRIDAIEYAWCLRLNRGCHRNLLRKMFVVVSRLGDGAFWYAFVALLPIFYGERGSSASIRMIVVGVAGVAIYKWLKGRLMRERPCVSLIGIVRGTPPLDRYSFPSGHTLHAVSFSTLIVASFPELAWLCVPFATLVAMSRVVLGLHYPSDVFAGALLGFALAGSALFAIPPTMLLE